MLPISVVIPVKNEEINLPICLANLSVFSEILIVDSSSTDRTREIAKNFDCRLIDFKWDGQFPKKRNWVLRNVDLKNEWVLFLDADEQVTQDFITEITHVLSNTNKSGFWIYYDNYFMTKRLRYGDKMRKLALFNRNAGEYEKIDESLWTNLDMEVHEHPVLKGTIGVIKSPLVHRDYKNLEKYIERHNSYSTWEAKRYMSFKNKGSLNLTFRQKIKYGLLLFPFFPSFYFIASYIFKLGFLDGLEGYYIAKFKKHYFFQIQSKIREYNRT
jgi:glycosyltransferase involved in cell wall biosynthesis